MKILLPSAIACSLLLAACGGSGSSSSSSSSAPQANASSSPVVASAVSSTSAQTSSPAPLMTGVFLDAAVANIGYRTNSQQGTTNQRGEFNYRPGEIVTFFIGGLELPATPAAPIITPLDIANTESLSDNQLVNILRLLQSLDADGDASNGIEITPAALAAGTLLDLTLPPEVFAQLPGVQTFLQAAGSPRQSLIDIEQAIAHFQTTLALLNGGSSSSASQTSAQPQSSSAPVQSSSLATSQTPSSVPASSAAPASVPASSSSSEAPASSLPASSSATTSSETVVVISSLPASSQAPSSVPASSSVPAQVSSSSQASSEVEASSSAQSSEQEEASSSSQASSEAGASSSAQSSEQEETSSFSQASSEAESSSSASSESSSTSSEEPVAAMWNLYNAWYHPASNGAVTLADGSLSEFQLSGTGDYFSIGSDGTVTLDTSSAGANTSGVSIANVVNSAGDYPKHFTLIAGITGNNNGLRVLELEVAMADVGQTGSRLKAILRNDGSNKGVQLESANNGASVNAYGINDMDQFAIYQIAITLTAPTKGSVQVYRNGSLMSGLSLSDVTMRTTSAAGDNFLRFGEVSGSAAYKSNVDWLVWTNAGAYTPLQAAETLPVDADLGCVYGYGEANDTTSCFASPASSSSSSSSAIGGESSSSSSFPPAEIRPALMEGFAAHAGVTGGAGGPVITVTTGTELNAALCGIRSSNRSAPVVIMVNGTINHANTTAQGCDTQSDVIEIKNTSNISIIGVGTNALFDEIGIHVRSASNIILQNLHIRNVKKSGTPTSNGGDAIGMETNVDRVWIDHNWLEASGGEKAGYDSLLDMKAGVTNVTVSYNLFNDSSRAGLIGSSDSDNKNNNITFHHNWYKNIEQRTPLIRHSLVHIYNNYWSNDRIDYMFHAINSRMDAKALVESNYFYNVNNPLIASDDSSQPGCWQTNNDNTVLPSIYYSRTVGNGALVIPEVIDGQLQSTCSVTVPYSVTMDAANDVPAIVMANAGVGKIDNGGTGSASSTSSDPVALSSSSKSSYASSVASWSEASVASEASSNSPNGSSLASWSQASTAPASSMASSFASSVASWSESSESSSANSLLVNEGFNVDKTTLFSAAYQSISTDPTAARYFITGGGTGITLNNNELSVAGGRFTIGHRPPRANTTSADTSANGDFDLSRPYRISFKVVSASGSGRVQVYIDNNTTSQGNSLHGNNSKVFEALVGALSAGQLVEITPAVGTANSFIALRAESSATVVIDDLQVEYLDGLGVSSSSASAGTSSQASQSVSSGAVVTSSSSTNSSSQASSVIASSSSAAYIPPEVNLSADCISLATNPSVNWRDTALQTDQEIVECLYQSLGTPVGYGEHAKGGYDPSGNSKLTIITTSGEVSVEEQLLEAITGEEHNWIVFDKLEFAQPQEIGMYRLGCSNPTVQSILNATEAECVNYQQWCANNNVSEASCVSTFFNTAMNKSNNPIRNPVIGSHKTIDGRMSEAYFLFSGFAIGRDSTGTPTQTAQSVILTHLSFKGAGHTEDHYVDPDMIRSTGASRDIWIHKNSFDTTGDSAFDVKVGAYNITMSFNHIRNVKRAALHGSSDSHTIDAQTRTSMLHNLFVTTDDSYMLLGNTLRRVPLIRRGSSHMLNNVFVNYRKDLLSIRVGASILQQDNMFVVNRIHQEKSSLEASLAELQSNLIRDVSGGNYRGEGNFLWFGDAACNLDETTKTGFSVSSGTVADLAENYTAESQGLLGNWRFAAGQELVDYLSATAGKYGHAPFNSPLAGDRHYVLGLGKVSCQ